MRQYIFPPEIEELLIDYAIQKGYIRDVKDIPSLAPAVRDISESFTKKRQQGFQKYLKAKQVRAAYLLYFLPANFPKIQAVLQELFRHPKLPRKGEFKVLDIGSGPGTALLGLAHFIAKESNNTPLHLTAIDHTEENLQDCQGLIHQFRKRFPNPLTLKTSVQDMEQSISIEGKFDFVILSNSLNELFELEEDRLEKRIGFLRRLIERHLEPDGTLIIVEPALKQTSRELLPLRDALVGSGYTIYAPCLDQAVCPIMKNEREDWCHEELPWEPPSIVKALDNETGFIKDAVKYSYAVFRKDGLNLSGALPQGSNWRVVSEMMRLKGDRRAFLCNGQERIPARRLDRHCSGSNKTFDELRRGDLLQVSHLERRNELYAILPATNLEQIKF